MRILCYILVVLFVTTTAVGQQINPVPDYIFRNSMSVGRNAPTDTSAYFSIGPRFGATRGFMPPMVVDTAAVTGTKRNGLLIYSIQRNSYLYWDSTGNRWSRLASLSDTITLSTRAWRQKGIDSVASVRIGGSGVTGYVPKFTAARTLDSSQIFQNDGRIGIGTASPLFNFHVDGNITGTISGMVRNSSSNSASYTFMRVGNNADNSAGLLRNSTTNTSYGGGGSLNVYQQFGNPIAFVTNNLERARVTGTGRFVINDTSGNNVLYVKGNNSEPNVATFINNNQYFGVNFWNNSTLANSNTSGFNLVNGTTFFGANDRTYLLQNVGTGASDAAFNLSYFNGTSYLDRFRIHSNGRIGVNTITDAGYQFDVAGSMRNTTDAYFATSSGNVGIGTTTPSYKLDILTTDRVRIRNTDASASAFSLLQMENNAGNTLQIFLRSSTASNPNEALLQQNNNGQLTVQTVTANPILFNTSTTERMRIHGNGNVTVGTSTDVGYRLDVSGSLRSTTMDVTGILRNATDAYFNTTSGNVGINTVSPVSQLHLVQRGNTIADGITISRPGSSRASFFIDSTTNTLNITRGGTGVGTGITIKSDNEVLINTTSDAGAFQLQVNGVAYAADGLRTGAPAGGTAATWKLGTVASVSPTSPNRTIEVDIGGTIYYIHAKTTND